ncbi:HesA/MoeB/ThiF family protein [Roseovarius sp. EGI FJ00037]|uniref:HesA/MoeB/ThiF family protein n=1 Tax=Roseovarius salincola TaxID=2978479 RepID=UPI0022A85807|nr:HesA/MoeB/ThiF family protein [Roseovarius sp. EGI FJ00037]MCZ0813850.1 HesA/MoeB/ThiF family protein [Roseovarius sp. EGI FJ00037]
MSRYARQIAVPGFGAHGQERLEAARVLVVGAGGLAAPVLQYLAGAGVGFIRLVDPDCVDETNLHRQTIFRADDLGRPKAAAATKAMRALNPQCRIEPHEAVLDPETAVGFCHGVNLVLDCADSFAVSYILSDHCMALNLPLISASVTQMAGYAGGFCGEAPSLRAIFPDLPQRLGNCAEDGVLGPVVGLMGSLQAQMALAVLTGLQPSPLGRLVSCDAGGMRFGGFRFDHAPEPEWQPGFIAPAALQDHDFIVDLRDHDEAELIRENARRLPVEAFGTPSGPRPEPGQRAVMCCRSGLRSWQAAERLRQVWDGDIVLLAAGD